MRLLSLIICVLAARALNPRCQHPEGRSPFIVAHQGGTRLHRRSSIDAYQTTADSSSADFLECDLASSSDHVLLCAHSPDFHRVADPQLFKNWFTQALPKSKQNFQPVINSCDGEGNDNTCSDYSVHDWLVPDYTWRLIELLSAQCPKTNPLCAGIGPERLARVDELIEIAYGRAKSGNPIGLYLEVKHQMWTMSRRAIDLIDEIISLLHKYSPDLKFPFPVYLQTFEYPDLLRIRQIIGYDTDICLVALIENTGEKLRIKETQTLSQERAPTPSCEVLEGLNMWNPLWLNVNDAPKDQLNVPCQDKHCEGLGFISSVETCAIKLEGDWLDHCQTNPAPKPTIVCPKVTPNWLTENIFIRKMAREICPKPHEKLLAFWTGPQSYDSIVDLTCLADIVGLDHKIISPKIVAQLKHAEIGLHLWTVNDVEKMQSLLQSFPSITGFITDEAALFKSQPAFSKPPL